MKKILIIGATSAIATACARIWTLDSCELFLVARNREKLELVAADLYARGAKKVFQFVLDANDFVAHEQMLQACLSEMHQIDITLIAHGTLPDQKACERDISVSLQEFSNNCTSIIALLTMLANHFEKQRSGTIAVITSVAGDRGRSSNYLYGTAKSAVSTFCEGLRARMFKVGVHVVDIKPGFVDTPMTHDLPLPALLVAKPEVVAEEIVKGIDKKSDIIYAPKFWALIMCIIRNIPQVIFKRLSL